MVADFSRCRIIHPDGVIPKARFVFLNGRAAAWTENDCRRKGPDCQPVTRLLFATDATFEHRKKARLPSVLRLSDGTEWTIYINSGGGCCGKRGLTAMSMDQLLADEVAAGT